ncbi:MAG: DUF1569 domain-containing protein [Rufibacter sp.]
MKNIFEPAVTQEIIQRLHRLRPDTQPQWGTMAVGQMLAHCNVLYEMVYSQQHPRPNAFKRFVLRLLVKDSVVNEKPYKPHTRTAPWFIIRETKDFDLEKARLIQHLEKTQALGAAHFEGKDYHSFGSLTSHEWNNMFYKHLDHHLRQFGV